MVTVNTPVYRDKESLRGRKQQGLSLSINPDQFGAAIGRGMGEMAKGLGDVSDALVFREDIKAEADGRDANNRYRGIVRSGMYDPNTGYLVRTGANALGDSRSQTFDSLASARSEIEAGLSPKARRVFQTMADGLDNSAKDTAIRHEGTELRGYTMDTFKANAQGYLDDALLNAEDQAKFDNSLALARGEIERAGALAGTSRAVLDGEQEKLTSGAHAGRVIEFARDNPIAAFLYLEANEEVIDRDTYNKLHDGLEGAYYQAEARSRVDARGGVGGSPPSVPTGDFIRYNNSGAERSQRLSPQLETSMSSLKNLGLGFEVTSGGQHSKAELEAQARRLGMTDAGAIAQFVEARREGSIRHDGGNSADGYFTKNGERLSWANPGHRAIVEEATIALWDAGVTGTGAGDGYMGEGMVHLGYGPDNIWGKNGKGENAAPWLKALRARYEAAGGRDRPRARGVAPTALSDPAGGAAHPPSTVGVTFADAMAEENPKLQAAMIAEIELRRKAYAADREYRQRQASDQAWDILDRGGDPGSIPPEMQAEIGLQGMNSIFDAFERNSLGVDTNDELRHLELIDQAIQDPAGFAGLDLNTERNTLSRGVLLSLKDMQLQIGESRAKLASEGAAAAVYTDAEMRTAFSDAKEQYEGLTKASTGASQSSDERAQYARFQTELWDTLRRLAKEDGRRMTIDERNNVITALLAPVIMDASSRDGSWTGTKGFVFDVPSGSREMFELTITPSKVPARKYLEIEERLTRVFSRKPSGDEVAEQYENELLMSLGYHPVLEFTDIPREFRRVLDRDHPEYSQEEKIDVFRQKMLEAANLNDVE